MSSHAEKGIKTIDEFFKTDAEMSEEEKLWQGLDLAVQRNWMSQEEADECYRAYITTRNK